jgi:hypothetical protein
VPNSYFEDIRRLFDQTAIAALYGQQSEARRRILLTTANSAGRLETRQIPLRRNQQASDFTVHYGVRETISALADHRVEGICSRGVNE